MPQALFYEYQENVMILWKPHALIKTTLYQINPKLYQDYCILEKEYLKMKLGILDESMDDKRAVEVCDAYYGDASPIVQKCRNEGKVVMLQNVLV